MKRIFFLGGIFLLCQPAHADLASVLEWKYGNCAGTRQENEKDVSQNPKMVISYWKCVDVQPTESEIVQIKQDYVTAKQADKQARKNRKKAALSKMGLNQSDISALLEFIEDRGDN